MQEVALVGDPVSQQGECNVNEEAEEPLGHDLSLKHSLS